VADGLFHGLRSLPEHEVVDVPRHDVMYRDATPEMLAKTGSRGRTLYGLLHAENEKVRSARVFWQRELEEYDLIIMADIAQMPAVFRDIYQRLGDRRAQKKLIIIDGYDTPARFPYFNVRNNLKYQRWVYQLPLHKVMYFKREFNSVRDLSGSFQGFLPFSKTYPLHASISMSVPEHLIEIIPVDKKETMFVQYNVDPDVSDLFENGHFADVGNTDFLFNTEEAYNNHLISSRFGITTKRAGWDCLRHYEYAAKGVILCFKNLNHKPELCAPFGLTHDNCIIYKNKTDLLYQLNTLTVSEITQIRANGYRWVEHYTTRSVAQRFIETVLR
jgi:hypothetical protein